MRTSVRLVDEIKGILARKSLSELHDRLEWCSILDIIGILTQCSPQDQGTLIKSISPERLPRLFKLLLQLKKPLIPMLLTLKSEDLTLVLSQCPPQEVRMILQLLSAEQQDQVLSSVSPDLIREIKILEQYSGNTAGGLMNPSVFYLYHDLTVEQALQTIRQNTTADMVFYLYITDHKKILKGVLSLRKLVTSEPSQLIKEIMTPAHLSVIATQTVQEVEALFEETSFLALPVTDMDGQLVGLIKKDDISRKLKLDTESDLLKISRVNPEELHGAPIHKIIPMRFPWLGASMIGGLLNAIILSQYTDLLGVVITLTLFIPVLLGLGETVATQTSTLIIRGLALKEFESHQKIKLLTKEILTGLGLGLICGLLLGFVAYLWTGNKMVGLILLITLTNSVTLAGIVGTVVPLTFKAFKYDPALASSAFVLTISDLITLIVYLVTASYFLHTLPH